MKKINSGDIITHDLKNNSNVLIEKTFSRSIESFDFNEISNDQKNIYLKLEKSKLEEEVVTYIKSKYLKLLSDFFDQHPEQTIWVKDFAECKTSFEEKWQKIQKIILFAKKKFQICQQKLSLSITMGKIYYYFDNSFYNTLKHFQMRDIVNTPFNFLSCFFGCGEKILIDKLGFMLYKDVFKVSPRKKFDVLHNPNTQNPILTVKLQFTIAKLFKNLIFAFVKNFQAGVKDGNIFEYNQQSTDGRTTYNVGLQSIVQLTSNLILDDKTKVLFISSNESIAKIIDDDKLKGVAVGIVIITAKFGIEQSFKFKVKVI